MGTIQVKADRAGAKRGQCIGFYADERRYKGDVFAISDEPLLYPSGQPIPGSLREFSDNKRGGKNPGWMEFVNPEDEKKYRAGLGVAAPAVKSKAEISDAERADFEAWKAEKAKAAEKKGTGDKDSEEKERQKPAPRPGKEAKGTGDKDVL